MQILFKQGERVCNLDKDLWIKRVIPVMIAIVMSSVITAYGFMVWHYNNPRYVVLPESTSDSMSDNASGDSFNPEYAITFDKNQVSFENIKKYTKVRDIIGNYYYEEVNKNTLLEGSIAGMANSLNDPYTVYFPKDQMEMFNEKSQGSYVGIGVSIIMDENGLLTVIKPFDDSPAIKAGIKKDDKIIQVDDQDVTLIGDEDMIISMIKGEENTDVKVTVFRPSEEKSLDFLMKRKRIDIVNISSALLEDNIGYIKIDMFDSNIAKDFGTHLNKLIDKNIKGLVIDVRDNPGGDYDQVVAIADRLVPEGQIVYRDNRARDREEERSDKTEHGMPLAILVNGNSASASEVLSGAVKDHKKGTLIGTTTFGKGLVQVVFSLDDGSGLKVTIAKYFTPSGVCIHGTGIEPDIVVEVPEEYRYYLASDIPRDKDLQLNKALEVIRGQISR